MDIVGNFIFHSNHCDANEYSSNFVKALISMAECQGVIHNLPQRGRPYSQPFLHRLVLIEFFLPDVTAESLRAKRDRKSAISLQRGQFDPKIQVRPHQSFLQLCRWQFSNKETLYQTFFKRSADENWPFCVLQPPPPFRGLGATCDDHLMFIGKSV